MEQENPLSRQENRRSAAFERVDEIVAKVKSLNLPEDSYVVFGSGPLVVARIRAARDIDLLVSEELLERLRLDGWEEVYKEPGDTPLTHDVFEAHANWNFSPYSPTLAHLLSTATRVEGVPFASLEEVRKWKAASGRPNDIEDIRLIDQHMRNST